MKRKNDIPRLVNTACVQAGIENVPLCADDVSLRKIGDVVTSDTAVSDKFYGVLFGKIAKQEIINFTYENRFKEFKGSPMGVGDVMEFLKPKDFAGEALEPLATRTGANVDAPSRHDDEAQYIAINLKARYKDTLDYDELKTAFTTLSNFNDYYTSKIAQLALMREYDETLTFQYLLTKMASQATPIYAGSTATNADLIAKVKATVRKACILPSKDYNPRGSLWVSAPRDIIVFADVDTLTDTAVKDLAQAMQLSEIEIQNRIIDIKSFTLDANEVARLKAIGVMGSSETAPTVDGLKYVVIDRRAIQMRDKKLEIKQRENEEGLFMNNWLHWHAAIGWINWATFVPIVKANEPEAVS